MLYLRNMTMNEWIFINKNRSESTLPPTIPRRSEIQVILWFIAYGFRIQSGPVSRLGRMLKESLCDLKGKNSEWWAAPIVIGGVSVGGYQPEVKNDHPFRICFGILYCLNILFYISEIGFTKIGQETKTCSFAVFGMFVSCSWCVAYAPNKFLVLPSLHPLAKMMITFW